MTDRTVLQNQRDLCIVGCYPARCGMDGIPGNGYRAAILAFKRQLVEYYEVPPRDLLWYEESTSQTNMDRAIFDSESRRYLDRILAGGAVNGHPAMLMLTKQEVAWAGLTKVELFEKLEALIGNDIPVPIFAAIVEHETRWKFFDLCGTVEILRWGADYTGTDIGYPRDLESLHGSILRSRGYGPGQITPPGTAMPPVDPWAGTPPGRWPSWCTSIVKNLEVAARSIFAEKFKSKSSLRVPCRQKGMLHHDCRACCEDLFPIGTAYNKEHTQREVCSWWEAVRRYAGDGPKSFEMVHETRDILLS
jgi:hypothetical protein